MTTTPPPAGLTTRPLTPADLDDVYAVYAADEIADAGHLAIEPEDLAGDWSRPSFDMAHDSIGVFEDGHVVAAAEVTRGGTRAEGAVHPDVRGRGIGSWLVDWTESRARAHGAASVGQNTPDGSTVAAAAARSRIPARTHLVGARAARGPRGPGAGTAAGLHAGALLPTRSASTRHTR